LVVAAVGFQRGLAVLLGWWWQSSASAPEAERSAGRQQLQWAAVATPEKNKQQNARLSQVNIKN
jgi:hypothetical protein